MNQDEILDRLRGIVREASVEDVDANGISAATTIESLGFDSLSILDLLYDIEQELDVKVEASDVIKAKTVGDVAELLAKRIGSA
jgi:acyl carrier protein